MSVIAIVSGVQTSPSVGEWRFCVDVRDGEVDSLPIELRMADDYNGEVAVRTVICGPLNQHHMHFAFPFTDAERAAVESGEVYELQIDIDDEYGRPAPTAESLAASAAAWAAMVELVNSGAYDAP